MSPMRPKADLVTLTLADRGAPELGRARRKDSTLEVSASAFYQRAKGERSARALEDERLSVRIAEIHEDAPPRQGRRPRPRCSPHAAPLMC